MSITEMAVGSVYHPGLGRTFMEAAGEAIETILKLLDEQDLLLKQWPYTPEQVKRDKEICLQLRDICDHMCRFDPTSSED
jgi:hypothetical protein